MAQNWWDKYPKTVPLAGLPLPLPEPGGMMPGAGMGVPPLPPQAFGAMPPSLGAFDPSSFTGGGFMGDKLRGAAVGAEMLPGRARQPDPGQQFFATDEGRAALDRDSAIRHAAIAVQLGADPNAVRARLHELGHGDVDSPGPFADLIPDRQQAPEAMAGQPAPPRVPQSALSEQNGLDAGTYLAAYRQDGPESLRRRADPSMAPQKGPIYVLDPNPGA